MVPMVSSSYGVNSSVSRWMRRMSVRCFGKSPGPPSPTKAESSAKVTLSGTSMTRVGGGRRAALIPSVSTGSTARSGPPSFLVMDVLSFFLMLVISFLLFGLSSRREGLAGGWAHVHGLDDLVPGVRRHVRLHGFDEGADLPREF